MAPRMDGIHDLGGMSGFGAVEVERNEPVFHAGWQARTFGLMLLGNALGAYNADEYRHAVERMDPADYLAASYYQRMLTGVATLLVEKGFVSIEDLTARARGRFPLSRPLLPQREKSAAERSTPRFALGDRVVVRNMHPAGHTRVPRYVRGKRGVVVHVAPKFSYPDSAAHGLRWRDEHTYPVCFEAAELWSDAAAGAETVMVDLWESYLESSS